MISRELIGRESKPVVLRIEADAVRRFAEAAGMPFNNQVPPTFMGAFLAANISGVELPYPGMIHGEQKFTYYQPVSVRASITYSSCIKDVYERTGKLGKMTFVVLETKGRNPIGELVFTSTSTLIAPDKEGESETTC